MMDLGFALELLATPQRYARAGRAKPSHVPAELLRCLTAPRRWYFG